MNENLELGLVEPEHQRLWVYGLLPANRPLCLDTCSPAIDPERRLQIPLDEHFAPYWEKVGQLLAKK